LILFTTALAVASGSLVPCTVIDTGLPSLGLDVLFLAANDEPEGNTNISLTPGTFMFPI
jgi:hypothetical protein